MVPLIKRHDDTDRSETEDVVRLFQLELVTRGHVLVGGVEETAATKALTTTIFKMERS
jgi:hypothetical protein